MHSITSWAPSWRRSLCGLLAVTCLSVAASGQNAVPPASPVIGIGAAPSSASDPAATSYSAEPIVIERAEDVISMLADGTGYREHTLVARLQADSVVKRYSVITLPYASNSQHIELAYARVRHPDGTVVETHASDAIEMPTPATRQAPFYSDLKELQLPLRSLHVGDTLELKYRLVYTRAEIPNQFWGQENLVNPAVVLSSSVELRVPAGMYVNVWSPTVKPAESVIAASSGTPAQHAYRWVYSQLKPTVGREAEAEAAAKKKVLWTEDQELDATKGKLPTIAWTTFKSWQEVGAWYRSLEADRVVPDDAVKAKAAELTAGKPTDEAKVQALYSYVATNIRYIGVAFGVGRYQPHTASEILSNQYGDCKDKHTLLAAMLAASGISSDAVLIGVRVRFNQAVPSPASFNHLITHLTLEGKPVWLDTTAEVAPYAMLTLPTRDKQALLIPSAGIASIVHTPTDPLVPNVSSMTAVGSLDSNGVSSSHIILSFRGDGEVAVRAAFRLLAATQYDQVVQTLSKTLGMNGVTSNPEISRAADMTQPFQLAYDYKREKAGDWDHLRTIAELTPIILPRVTDIDPPVHAIQLGGQRTEESSSRMKLPEGWTAHLPASIHASCPYATYDLTYRLDAGALYAERRLVILSKEVPVQDWKTYQAWVDKVNPGREPYIQLVNGSSPSRVPDARTKQIEDALNSSDSMLKGSVAHAPAAGNTHLGDAQLLAEQGVRLREKIAAATVSMEEKVDSFDQMQILGADWENLGWIYYRVGQYEKADRYMHAAWELKPRNVDINIYMGSICEAQHKPDEAAKFYRMALTLTNSPNMLSGIQARLTRLGAGAADPLRADVVTPLPALNVHLETGAELWVDILLSRGAPAAISLSKQDPAIEKPLAQAVQVALKDDLPDDGPEKLLRRARLTCSSDQKPLCALHFIGSQVAMQASAGNGNGGN